MNEFMPTIGVEEEYLLLDCETGSPVSGNRAVARTAERMGLDLQLELSGCQVEAATGVHRGVEDLLDELRRLRRDVAAAAKENRTIALAAGVSPTDPSSVALTASDRYRRIGDSFGLLAREEVVCGCHVHVEVPDREVAVQVSNFLRPWLPVLLALTANSRVHHTRDTGYASWRNILWHRWPSAGPPPYFTSGNEYDTHVDVLLAAGVILDRKMIYWDVRPSISFPTVEVRVSDVPATVTETALLASLVRGLVVTAREAVRHNHAAPAVSPELLRAAYWKAARTGLDGDSMDPADGGLRPMAERVRELVEHVGPVLDRCGERDFVETTIRSVLADGNGAQRQARALARRGRVDDLVDELAETTLTGCH
ncbi:glutamate--cysteine ligase [Nocardia sp. NPDC004068]|uniref:carboxylate-amine ligase n=1 Tax=Nocardia sp. NPDC004068 TaxID=3364303 RepID=UPI0036946FC5